MLYRRSVTVHLASTAYALHQSLLDGSIFQRRCAQRRHWYCESNPWRQDFTAMCASCLNEALKFRTIDNKTFAVESVGDLLYLKLCYCSGEHPAFNISDFAHMHVSCNDQRLSHWLEISWDPFSRLNWCVLGSISLDLAVVASLIRSVKHDETDCDCFFCRLTRGCTWRMAPI